MVKVPPTLLRLMTLVLVTLVLALSATPGAVAAPGQRETTPPASSTPAPASLPGAAPGDPHFRTRTLMLSDGAQVDELWINGPSEPPPGSELSRTPVDPAALNGPEASQTLATPAYDWVFGCGAVAGAMIAAYFDRNGLPNIYTGPTNGGVMPMNNSVWPRWTDGAGVSYPSLPLAASRQGLDGRATRGSIDDYWVAYDSSAPDPYIGHWTQHTWGDAIGDYMKTSQSAYGNTDGSSVLYTWNSSPAPLTCANMEAEGYASRDGTYGRKLFYQARGYAVGDCYNQKTDNNGGGFTFTQYKAQIDAGFPVFIFLKGHFVAGVGYADPATVYLNDTWDHATHQMTWGGSYSNMQMLAVGIVNPVVPTSPAPTINSLNPASAKPGGAAFTLTVNGANFASGAVVRWNGSNRATTRVSSTQLNAAITAADIATPRTVSVTAFNPAPGGGVSNALSFVVSATGGPKKLYVPLVRKNVPPPTGPTPGFWQKADGAMEFYVTPNGAYVDDFAVRVNIEGCGRYIITHTVPEPIAGNRFTFGGTFYASGVFSSLTAASGTMGLSNFYISGCGYVTSSLWTWSANWRSSAQPGPAAAASYRLASDAGMPGYELRITDVRRPASE